MATLSAEASATSASVARRVHSKALHPAQTVPLAHLHRMKDQSHAVSVAEDSTVLKTGALSVWLAGQASIRAWMDNHSASAVRMAQLSAQWVNQDASLANLASMQTLQA